MYIVHSKKRIIWVIVVALIGISVGLLIKNPLYLGAFSNSHNLTIIIDAGHGIPDGGAVGINGTIEQKINLAISKKIQEILEGKGIKTIMTRNDENGLYDYEADIKNTKRQDMKKRLEIMKNSNADLFISIHMNFFSGTNVNGLRVFYDSNHGDIKPLAEKIQSNMHDITGAKTTTVKTADTNLFLMKNPPIPALLIECGFLSNADEESKLNNDDYQSRLAWAIADSIEKYYLSD